MFCTCSGHLLHVQDLARNHSDALHTNHRLLTRTHKVNNLAAIWFETPYPTFFIFFQIIFLFYRL